MTKHFGKALCKIAQPGRYGGVIHSRRTHHADQSPHIAADVVAGDNDAGVPQGLVDVLRSDENLHRRILVQNRQIILMVCEQAHQAVRFCQVLEFRLAQQLGLTGGVHLIAGNAVACGIITLITYLFKDYVTWITLAFFIIAVLVVLFLIIKLIIYKPSDAQNGANADNDNSDSSLQ